MMMPQRWSFARWCVVMAACSSLAAYAAKATVDDDDTLTEAHLSAIITASLQLHVARNELTPVLAAATMSNFIEMLDYSKVFLMQSDVDEINACRLWFPQAHDKGEWSFVTGMYARFLQRLDEQTTNAIAYLAARSFTLETNRTIVANPKKVGFPATVAEAHTRLEDMLQYQVAYLVSMGEPLTGAVLKVEKRRLRYCKQFHDLKHRELLSLFLNSFCRALDPHSAYMSFDDLDEFQISMSLALEGIGAVLTSEEGVTAINALTPGGPADKSGLVKPGDKIMAVAQGSSGEFLDIFDMDLRDVVKKVRGKKDTIVRLQLVRKTAKGAERLLVTLTRDKVKLEDQAARMEYVRLARTNDSAIVRSFTIAVIDLPSFYSDPGAKPTFGKSTRSAVSDMRRLLQICHTSGVDAVVLDMQRNGGGLLDEAVDVAGLFFRKGNVVVARDRRSTHTELADDDSATEFKGPLAVTVSRATASGAEIVAGALQDYHRALIVGGDHTYGKGTIQQVVPLPGKLGAIKITVGEYFLASGRSPQHSGVIPDIVIPSELSALDIGEQYEDCALPATTVENKLSSLKYIGAGAGGWDLVDPLVVTQISLLSQARINDSTEFKRIRDSVKKIRDDRNKERVAIASLLQSASTNKPGNANATAPVPDDAEPPAATSSRQPITNDVVVMEAVQILADWLVENDASTSTPPHNVVLPADTTTNAPPRSLVRVVIDALARSFYSGPDE